MTDFERKPEKAKDEQTSQGDPLLELTRLFATRSISRQDETPQEAAQSQTTHRDGQTVDDGWMTGLSAQPTGLSMTGSVLLAGYGAKGEMTTSPEPASDPMETGDTPLPERSVLETMPDWMGDVVPEEAEALPGEEEEFVAPQNQASTPADLIDSNWEDTPAAGVDYDDEQLFDALAGDLTAPLDVASLDKPLNETPPHDLPQSSSFSGGYFGYGQSVQVNVFAPTESVVSLSSQPTSSPAEPTNLKAAEVSAPVAPDPIDNFADFSSSDPAQIFAETLHDFDLTIKEKKRRRRTRPVLPPVTLEKTEAFELPPLHEDGAPSSAGKPDFAVTLGADQLVGENHFFGSLPYQETQDKPPLPDEEAVMALAAAPVPMSEDKSYDWVMPTDKMAKEASTPPQSASGTRKYKALSFVVLLGILGGGGYWSYHHFYGEGKSDMVLIKASPDAIKTKPESAAQIQVNGQDMAVYNRDDSNLLGSSQETLLDGSEPPVNLDILGVPPIINTDEASIIATLPASSSNINTGNLDPVDASILAATQRVVPLHIVPTVAIERDQQGNVLDIPHIQERDEVFIPAGDYRAQILHQLEQRGEGETDSRQVMGVDGETIPPDEVLTARSPEITDLEPVNETPMPPDEMDVGTPTLIDEAAEPLDSVTDTNSLLEIQNPPSLIPSKPADLGRIAGNIPAATTPPQIGNPQAGTVVDERFYVQISSQPSRDAALESANEVRRRFASLIGNNPVVIVPADIPGRGLYYRVRVLVSEHSEAVALCENYKAAGGSCFVGR